ncbi:MAG: tRNA lysidine(34) synthetase TilS [Verrucomicrobiota bacterium]|nr:tRNA lysidine(34) synthetase TilS [Verrucomicrobiota bacterium]
MSFPSPETAGISNRKRYLVGVSGGRDSVALLHWLKFVVCSRDIIVCHFNHSLRGRESGSDARFVRNLAKSYNFQFEYEKKDVRKISEQKKSSIEVTARDERLVFFAKVSRKWRCKRIILAHHADDNVETVLMNLFRGSGRLTGIRKESKIVSNGVGIELLRPFLSVWRSDIDSYVTANSIRYREDTSNRSNEFLRNRVRNTLIPKLKKIFQRDIAKSVSRAAEVSMRESDMIDEILLSAEFSWINKEELPLTELNKLNDALQARAILYWLRKANVPGVGFTEVELVRSLLKDESTAKINLPGGKYARRRNKVIFID